jgi:hypothetical protein
MEIRWNQDEKTPDDIKQQPGNEYSGDDADASQELFESARCANREAPSPNAT